MAVKNRKRSNSSVNHSNIEPRRRQSKRGRRSSSNSPSDSSERHVDATIFRTQSNPQATFCGLPAELRLQIYSHLCDTTLVHVHCHDDVAEDDEDVFGDRWMGEEEQIRFTWTPCRTTSTASPLLCANPKWSGMCEEKDRCTHKLDSPAEHRGFFGLAATSKSIRNEATEFFLRETTFSINALHLRLWLDYLEEENPERLKSLKRLTLMGPNICEHTKPAFPEVRRRLPQLEAFGFQCQDSSWSWQDADASALNTDAIRQRCHNWTKSWGSDWMRDLDQSVDMIFEFMTFRRLRTKDGRSEEQQAVIRISRPGGRNEADDIPANTTLPWKYEEYSVEIVSPGKLVASDRKAGWRKWWRGSALRRIL